MKKIIIVMGPPGCGKGTQAKLLEEKFQIKHISTGDLFREEIKKETELGKLAKSFIDKGQYVPDDVTIGMLKNRISMPDCENGFILDGFPRTIPQAEFLDAMLKEQALNVSEVIFYDVKDSTVIARIKGRAENDRLAGKNVRDDDLDVNITQRRLDTYHAQTKPVLEFYKRQNIVKIIYAERSVEDIFEESIN
jgi:adenylate kinase